MNNNKTEFQKMLDRAVELRVLGYTFKEAIPILKENHPTVKKITVQQLTELKQAFKKNEEVEFFSRYSF